MTKNSRAAGAPLSPPLFTSPGAGATLTQKLLLLVFAPDFRIRRFLERKFGGRARTDRFGLVEALAFAGRVDVWQRYAPVAEAIKALGDDASSILELGSGSGGVSRFLDTTRYHIHLLDPADIRVPADTRVGATMGDGRNLPFKDESFDAVVSVASFEHVPRAGRDRFADEAKRVAARAVIIQVPAVSADGQWNGTEMDVRFNRWHHRLSGMWDRNTTEHIDEGLPSVEELRRQFAGALLQGQQHGTTWLWCMLLARLPFLGLMTGFVYLWVFERRAHRPPYYACLLTYMKRNPVSRTASALPAMRTNQPL